MSDQEASQPQQDIDPALLKAMNAAPSRSLDNVPLSQARPMPQIDGVVMRRPVQADFPPIEPVQEVSQTVAGGGGADFSFMMEGAKDPDDDFGAVVTIHDGEVNGEVPTGMGTDDFFLNVNFDGAFINLIVTYNTTDLSITSLTFAVESDVADPTLGTFRVEIGRVFLDFDSNTGKVTNVSTVNTQCGDINFQLIFGSLNGQPSIIPIAVYAGFVSAI